METKQLIQLIETVSKTLNEQGFEHISLNHEGTSLTLNKQSVQGQVGQSPVVMAAPAPVAAPVSSAPASTPAPVQEAAVEASSPVVDDANFLTIDSPIVGTFYDSPSPDAEAYVKVGSKVKKGDVVCIIEAMKLMNEIEAEVEGEIVEILTSNEGPVEYGQALYKVKPL